MAGALVAGLLGCSPTAEQLVGQGWLQLDEARIELDVTECALLAGHLIDQVPAGGSEVSLVAEGRSADQRPVRVVARRGTDVVAPHRFDVLEVEVGEVEGDLRVLVLLRGFDRDTGRWSQIDPDAPLARRDVDGPLFAVDGAELRAHTTAVLEPGGDLVPIVLEAGCPPATDADPGVA